MGKITDTTAQEASFSSIGLAGGLAPLNVDPLKRFGGQIYTKEGERGPWTMLVTERYEYAITAVEPTADKPKGYLGCTVSRLVPDPGETWRRGRDLADGSYSEETWLRILWDVIAYEMGAGATKREPANR